MTYILLVEDNQAHADLVIRTLEAAGYHVRHTMRGLDAAALTQQERPSLILMDFDLPDIDGRNMVLLLRKQLGGKDAPPIVAVTARTSELDMRHGQRLGCAAFVGKPFLPEELLGLVDNLLKGYG
ncbi:MAG: response regulator [Anaerolineae bacterium]|nr:response regulator [Anaerolineae bacterium]